MNVRYPNEFNLENIKSILMRGETEIYVIETLSGIQKWQAIHYCCISDSYYDIAKLLIETSKNNLEVKTHIGDTPLKIARLYNSKEVIKLLIDNGAVVPDDDFNEVYELYKNGNITICI
jgi:ankyrin repeat protein